MDVEIGGETFHKEPNLLEQIAYRDTWGRGADSFIAMIYERLILMRDLLAPDGSIFVHCDWRVQPFIRSTLDEIFGVNRHVNQIEWCYSIGGKGNERFARKHDTIYFYSKGEKYYFNGKNKDSVVDRKANSHMRLKVDADGRPYQEKTDSKSGKVYRYYVDEGKIPEDYWTDIEQLNWEDAERLAYPTQKPEKLLRRIIAACTQQDDLIADFFCGSGTTVAVAEKLGRKWIATDLGKFGIHTTRKRLIGVQRQKKADRQEFRAFEVLNLGRYERAAYLNVGGRLSASQKAQALAQKEQDFRDLILRAYKATGFGGAEGAQAQDGFFHGARNGRLVVIGPINLPVGRLFVEEVITECRKRGASRVDVLAFEFEMGLFPAVLEEARSKGIDLLPRYIPAQVFDKRAVDKGQVVFHDISFVEATPRYEKKNKLAVSIELTDFSVYYSQGAAEAAIAAMKEGKSEVMCEQGQLYKVSKSKDGIVTKDRLTKHWTDWVDYWAVDFDYFQRQEIIKVPVGSGLGGIATLPGFEPPQGELVLPEFEERWTGGYIFENEWQSFRTRQNRKLELTTALHTYERAGRYTVAVKVIDIFGNDTMTLVPVNVG